MKRIVLLLTFAVVSNVHAGVKLPGIFGDHMVLQQEANLPVWGWADPGEKVTVTFGDKKAGATAGADGSWRVDLPAVPAGTQPGTLVVTGKDTVTINDVLVGEVWVCSGQSNMEFGISLAHNAKEAIANAGNPQIRLFMKTRTPGIVPRTECGGQWVLCTPDSIKIGGWNGFSAVAYFFGREIQQERKVPVGLIETCWGGTPAQSWTSVSALAANPVLKHYADNYNAAAAQCPGGQADFEAKIAAYNAADLKWIENRKADPAFEAALDAWGKTVAKAKAAGQPPSPQPVYSVPRPPQLTFVSAPTLLFNGMIHPLIPFAIKGAIWYQGEANQWQAMEYRTLLAAMITDWRTRWAQGDFPFLIVQLPNCGSAPKTADDGSTWPLLRESQSSTLSLPDTGMAVTIDLGTEGIHPYDKLDVGRRLALAARHVAYGENLVYRGPLYDSVKTEGPALRIAFKSDSVGGGLVIGSSPWIDPRATQVSKTDLQGFAIAGEDKKWVWAGAKIDGNTVVVSSPEVSKPVAVRYAWSGNPACNLYNKEGLPAEPFRTDAPAPPAK